MRKHSLLLITLLLVLLTAFAVHGEADSRRLTIVLDENPTTGYGWTYTLSAEGMLREVSSEYAQDAESAGLMGAGGKRTWVFEGLTPGDVTLRFSYARPFEEGVGPVRSVSYFIRIGEGLQPFMRGHAEAAGTFAFISLAENPTTGYQWAVELSAEGILDQDGDEYMPDPAPEGMTGSGGTHTWRFAALAPGQVTLRFSLQRSWESGAEDALSLAFASDGDLNVSLLSVE